MDTRLRDVLDELVKAEKAKKKKKSYFGLPKEKRIMYYSGWHKDDKPVTENKGEQQKKLI